MSGWLNPEIDRPIALPFTNGSGSIWNYYQIPHRTLVMRFDPEEGHETDNFVLCVGCTHIPSETTFSFQHISCCRDDEYQLTLRDANSSPLVICHAVRLFGETSLRDWLGEGVGSLDRLTEASNPR